MNRHCFGQAVRTLSVAVTLFILLGVPSSGAAVSVELMPGFFSFLHPGRTATAAGEAIRYRSARYSRAGGQSAPRSISSELSRRQHG